MVGVEPAGRVRRRWAHRYVLVDLRERQQVIAPQDIPTSDGLGVRVSAVVRWAVIDPVAWLDVSQTPVDVLHIATQLAAELVTAKLRGAAALEAARSETAALRALANGARLLDEHPALAQLRLVQATPPGTRLVLQPGGTPEPSTD